MGGRALPSADIDWRSAVAHDTPEARRFAETMLRTIRRLRTEETTNGRVGPGRVRIIGVGENVQPLVVDALQILAGLEPGVLDDARIVRGGIRDHFVISLAGGQADHSWHGEGLTPTQQEVYNRLRHDKTDPETAQRIAEQF